MKKSKEHQKFSFKNFPSENFQRKIFNKLKSWVSHRLEVASNVDERRLRNACQLAGMPYVGEDEAIEELRQYTYKRLNVMRQELEAQQEEVNAQLRGLAKKVEAIGTSLQLIEKAEEAKLKGDIEKLKVSGEDAGWLEELEIELQE